RSRALTSRKQADRADEPAAGKSDESISARAASQRSDRHAERTGLGSVRGNPQPQRQLQRLMKKPPLGGRWAALLLWSLHRARHHVADRGGRRAPSVTELRRNLHDEQITLQRHTRRR